MSSGYIFLFYATEVSLIHYFQSMRQLFNALFFIRKTRTVKSGEIPIMLRISIQGQLAGFQLKRIHRRTYSMESEERAMYEEG